MTEESLVDFQTMEARIARLHPEMERPDSGWFVWHVANVSCVTSTGMPLGRLSSGGMRKQFRAQSKAVLVSLQEAGLIWRED